MRLPGRHLLVLCCAGWILPLTGANALPLWKLEGTANQIYLLGSIHFLRAEDYPLPAPITDAVSGADIVVMELDLSRLDPIQMQSTLNRMAVDDRGRDLEQLLGARYYRQAHELAADIDIDLATMRQYEPWYAALQVTQLHLMHLGFDGSFGIETQLLLQAMLQGKELLGLETLEEQLGVLDSLPADTQKKFLIQTLEDAAAGDDKLDSIVAAWKTGDSDALHEDLVDQLQDHPKLYDNLILHRNRNWTDSILAFTEDNRDYLIVVGALHLVGDDSVIRMLADAGFPARQIKSQ